MDRIILQVKVEGITVNRMFLQSDAGELSIPIENADFTPAIRASYEALVTDLQATYGRLFQVEERFLFERAITPVPHDPTITRKAFANFPKQTGNTSFEMPVSIKHYRNGEYIGKEVADFVETLKASNQTMIEVNGVMHPEFDYFAEAIKHEKIPDLVYMNIDRMDAIGRFDNAYTPVVA